MIPAFIKRCNTLRDQVTERSTEKKISKRKIDDHDEKCWEEKN